MLSLFLGVASSALVAVCMRLSAGRVRHELGMLAMNYIVCVGLSALFSAAGQALPPGQLPLLLLMGGINGLLYLAGFILIQFNTSRNGVVLTSIFQKLGLLVAMVVSIGIFREIPSPAQILGFLLALAAIFLMNGGGQEAAGSRSALLWMLLACGLGEAMSKIFKESSASALESQFLLVTFFAAMTAALFLTLRKGQRIGPKELVWGSLIAVPNFFSAKFVLGALETLPAVIVYPVYSVGSILAVTLAGLLLFRERLARWQWLGIAAILVALVLLNV